MTDSHLESLYQEAKSALKARDYEYAIELLKRVLVVDENYKDTSRLLEKAVRLRKLRWYNNPRLWGALGLVVVFVLGFVIAPRIGGLFANPATTNTISPIATNTALLTATPTSPSTVTPTRTPRPTPTATPIPAWVTDFAEPILAAIKDRKPYFEDDFGPNTEGWVSGYPNLPISIEEGVLRLEQGGSVNNIYLRNSPNFVLQVDVSRPTSCCIHVKIRGENSIYLQPLGWGICRPDWSDCNGFRKSFGQEIQVIVIVRNSQAGFYLMGVPVFHFEDPDLADIGRWGNVSFECGEIPCEFDNVKFWNLDKIPNLP